MPHTETIPFGRVVWQTDTAKTYWCESCQTWLRSQYEGDENPTIRCAGPMADHVLEWPDVESARRGGGLTTGAR